MLGATRGDVVVVSVTRPPVAAGSFYPADRAQLARLVDELLAAARLPRLQGELRALVVPHAGYVYSGAVAATAFASLPAHAAGLRVALLGPSHFTALHGAAVSGADAWRTPLGTVPVDGALRASAVEAGAVVDDRPHDGDHALEVELPFLQRLAGDGLRVLPVAVGDRDAGSARLVGALADDAVVVVSSDLSHYHDDATARKLDRRTAQAVLALDDGAIGDLDACGCAALRALLAHAARAGWTSTLLDLRTSADASGDRRHVVGYGAFAFTSDRRASGPAPRTES
jgi:AmmeMemoRadiSam system protein B